MKVSPREILNLINNVTAPKEEFPELERKYRDACDAVEEDQNLARKKRDDAIRKAHQEEDEAERKRRPLIKAKTKAYRDLDRAKTRHNKPMIAERKKLRALLLVEGTTPEVMKRVKRFLKKYGAM